MVDGRLDPRQMWRQLAQRACSDEVALADLYNAALSDHVAPFMLLLLSVGIAVPVLSVEEAIGARFTRRSGWQATGVVGSWPRGQVAAAAGHGRFDIELAVTKDLTLALVPKWVGMDSVDIAAALNLDRVR